MFKAWEVPLEQGTVIPDVFSLFGAVYVCEFQCVGGWISVPTVISSGDTDKIKDHDTLTVRQPAIHEYSVSTHQEIPDI